MRVVTLAHDVDLSLKNPHFLRVLVLDNDLFDCILDSFISFGVSLPNHTERPLTERVTVIHLIQLLHFPLANFSINIIIGRLLVNT